MDLSGLMSAVVGERQRVVYECRRCGTTLRVPDDHCPYCGPTDVVTYELSE